MTTLIHERVSLAREGENPTVICRVLSGWVVLGDVQFLRGYSLLLPDPVVADFNALTPQARAQYAQDGAAIGDALLAVTDSYRINYEILGNADAALHMHIFPRYRDEEPTLVRRPAWFYDWTAAPPFDLQRDRELMAAIAAQLRAAGVAID